MSLRNILLGGLHGLSLLDLLDLGVEALGVVGERLQFVLGSNMILIGGNLPI